MTSTPVISKGSSFQLSTGTLEMKGLIIEDPTPVVGEAEAIKVTAHDGTKYTTTGTPGDNTLELTVLQTYEDLSKLLNHAYGSASVVGSDSTWSLASTSNTSGTITIATPANAGKIITWRLIAAKGLVVTPSMPIGGFASAKVKFSGDNWEVIQHAP